MNNNALEPRQVLQTPDCEAVNERKIISRAGHLGTDRIVDPGRACKRKRFPQVTRWQAIGLLGLAASVMPAHSSLASEWRWSGDIRAGLFASERTARDGAESDDRFLRGRLRLGGERDLSEEWLFRARAAGRYGGGQDGTSTYLRGYAPTATGAELGDTTLDELYLRYAPSGADWSLRVGRFQAKFELPGVPAKSLSRNDSPNIDITWTDGVHLVAPVADGWKGHLILQHNHRHGTGTTARSPLDFSDSGSRAGVFVGLEAKSNPAFPVRMIDLTWLPDALASEGVAQDRREDYLAASGRASTAWPLGSGGMKLVAGGEIGYAFRTPFGSAAGTGETGRSDGLAWQIGPSLYDIWPGHHIGVVYGRTGAGWLISPDFRPNDELMEVRYQWRFTSKWSMEARLRQREEITIPSTASRERVDRDLYIRVTGRF